MDLFGPIWSIWEATGNGLFVKPHIFHAHVLYREVLVSLQSSALSLVTPRKKNTKVEAFLLRDTFKEIAYYAPPVKLLIAF